MTWAGTMDLPGMPAEAYDAVHRTLLERTRGTVIDGLLLHLARETDDGMQVTEVWRSREDFERYERDVVQPVLGELLGPNASPPGEPVPFEVRGLVLPVGGIAS